MSIKQRKEQRRGFPGSPAVKTLPSNAGGAGLIPGRGAKSPYASWPKNQNIKQKQYCNKFNKDLRMVHIKKIFKKKKRAGEPEMQSCWYCSGHFTSYPCNLGPVI